MFLGNRLNEIFNCFLTFHLGQSSSTTIPDEERNKGHFLNEISGNRVLENQLKHLWNSFENVHSEDHITTVENCKTCFDVDDFVYSTNTEFFRITWTKHGWGIKQSLFRSKKDEYRHSDDVYHSFSLANRMPIP